MILSTAKDITQQIKFAKLNQQSSISAFSINNPKKLYV